MASNLSSQETEKQNENNVGSRIVNLDSFMKDMEECKSCHEGKHISQSKQRLYLNFKVLTVIIEFLYCIGEKL